MLRVRVPSPAVEQAESSESAARPDLTYQAQDRNDGDLAAVSVKLGAAGCGFCTEGGVKTRTFGEAQGALGQCVPSELPARLMRRLDVVSTLNRE